MEVDVGDSLGGMLAYIPQLYDRWERECVLSRLHEGATFVDVGSNIGVYSLWAAKGVGERGRVIAIEAEPRNYRRLVTNIALNGMTKRIKAFNAGVSDKDETLTLYLSGNDNSGGHTFSESVHTKNMPDTISVSCRPLMSLLEEAKVTRVDLMKLDIEGFEQRVLSQFFRDAAANSSLRPRFILCEFYWGRSSEPGSLDHVLLQNGYVLLEEQGTNALYEQNGGR
jgi:FkbM family methyltransferase